MPTKEWLVKKSVKLKLAPCNRNSANQSASKPVNKPASQPDIQQFADLPEKKLWHSFALTRDAICRQRLIQRYIQFARDEALNFYRTKVSFLQQADYQELCSDAVLGMVHAIDAFQLQFGTNFQVFARSRIRGEMIDGLRRLQHFPRIVAKNKRILKPLFEALHIKLGHNPTIDEFCSEYGEEQRKLVSDPLFWSSVYTASDSNKHEGSCAASNDETLETLYTSSRDTTRKRDRLQKFELVTLIDRLLVDRLSQQIIWLYYFMGLNSDKISRVLKVSQSSVVLKRKLAIDVLKEHKAELHPHLTGHLVH